MSKVYRAVVVINNSEQIISETAKNIKDFIRKLELRNYKIKKILGET